MCHIASLGRSFDSDALVCNVIFLTSALSSSFFPFLILHSFLSSPAGSGALSLLSIPLKPAVLRYLRLCCCPTYLMPAKRDRAVGPRAPSKLRALRPKGALDPPESNHITTSTYRADAEAALCASNIRSQPTTDFFLIDQAPQWK